MSIEIKEIHTRKQLTEFVKFPLELYKNNPYYVPSLIKDELNDLDTTKNPSFDQAEVRYFLAYKNGKIAGRIAAIINFIEVNELKIKKLRWGWFDVIDDLEVTKALFEKLAEIARSRQLEFMEGPVGATSLEGAGMLTYGFDRISTSITLYNYEYYPKHLEQLGFETANEWVEHLINRPEQIAQKVINFSELVQKRYNLRVLRFRNRSEMKPYIAPVFNLLEETYKNLDSFVPITQAQKDFYAEKYVKILHPDFINFIVDENNEMCAFAITMPTYAKALQKAKGKLFPLGWYHLLQSQKKNDTVEFVLIGVHPNYQRKGVTAIIFYEMFKAFKKHNIKLLETNPELVNNQSVQALWKDYDPIIHKRRKTFRKNV